MSVAEEITFHNAPTKVGLMTLYTSEEDLRMVFSLQQGSGEPMQSLWTSRSRKVHREEVLAVRGPVAERLRVNFVEDVTTTALDGQKNRTVGPLVGDTFELERKNDNASVAVFDTSGAPVRFGVAAQVTGKYRHFGRTGNAETVKLPVGPQRVGQSSPEIAQSLAAELSRGMTINDVDVQKATLSEIRQGPNGVLHGLYHVEMKVTGESDSSLVTLDLKGTLLLRDVDGARLEVRLQGPIKSAPAPGEDGAVDPEVPSGTGEFKLTQTMAYARA